MASDADPLEWWKNSDLHVARRYIAIPASAAEVERLFSYAGVFTGSVRRSNFKHSTLAAQVYVKYTNIGEL
jgi:hypothetical protein